MQSQAVYALTIVSPKVKGETKMNSLCQTASGSLSVGPT